MANTNHEFLRMGATGDTCEVKSTCVSVKSCGWLWLIRDCFEVVRAEVGHVGSYNYHSLNFEWNL